MKLKECPEIMDDEETCDDCDAPNAKDYGHTILCNQCAKEYDLDPRSDYDDRMHERRQMGLINF